MYLQYGCGFSAPKEWVNYDNSPTLLISKVPVLGDLLIKKRIIPNWPPNVKYGDIIKGLPHDEQTCKAIYCSHVLEHLSLEDFRIALLNTQKLLINNGIFRFVVPDLEKLTTNYIESEDTNASLTFMSDSYLGKKKRDQGLKALFSYLFGNSSHLWMWDFKSIKKELIDAGFYKIRRAEYGDSSDSMFNLIESKGRWDNCLGVECFKKDKL